MQSSAVATVVPEEKPAKRPSFEKRARSVPYKRPFIIAVVSAALYYLSVIGLCAALFSFFGKPGKTAGIILVVMIGCAVVSWLLSYATRHQAHCPLCKGTPFLDNSAHYHEKAFRFYPLNHGTSNAIRAIIRQQFRCQFCGTPFDLLKPMNRQRARQGQERRG